MVNSLAILRFIFICNCYKNEKDILLSNDLGIMMYHLQKIAKLLTTK